MDDNALITEGRKVVADITHRQLDLGRLALQFAPIGTRGQNVGTNERIRLYAEKIGMDERTLRVYRMVAHAWDGVDGVENVPFSALRTLAPAADKPEALKLAKPGVTKDALRKDAIDKGVLKERARRRTPGGAEKLASVRDVLQEITADDLERTDDKVNIKTLFAIIKEAQRLQRLVEQPKVEARKKKEPARESVAA